MRPSFTCFVIHRTYLGALGLVLLVAFMFSLPKSYPLAVFTTALTSTEIKYDVVLDAGHGGVDPGSIGGETLYEKEITLDLVLRMKPMLEAAGLSVGLTRDSDTDVTHLADGGGTRHRRDLLGRFQGLHSGRLGMSVHANAALDETMHGAIVFYRRDFALAEEYAQAVFDELEQVQVMNHDFVVPRSNLLLLKAKPPVIMVEIGFLTHERDLEKLADPQFRDAVARALSNGIIGFYAAEFPAAGTQ